MKIVVLAGGTSTERSVSITSGTMVCKALREKNHQAVLVDVFCGIDVKGNLEDVFAEEAYDIDKAAEYMHSFDAGLNVQSGICCVNLIIDFLIKRLWWKQCMQVLNAVLWLQRLMTLTVYRLALI